MSRMVRALKFAHSPQLMKPALVHTPPRHPTLSDWVEQACGLPCSLPEHRSRHKDRHAEDTMGWEEARLAQSQGCAQFYSIIPAPIATGAMQSSLWFLSLPPPPFHLFIPPERHSCPFFLLSDVLTPTEIRRMRNGGWQLGDDPGMQCAARKQQAVTMVKFQTDAGCAKSELTWPSSIEGLIWSALSSWTGIDLIDGMVSRQWPALIFLLQRSLILSTFDRSVIDLIDQNDRGEGSIECSMNI